MDDKRYIFFIGTLKYGGAERVVSILTKYMAETGFKVEILLYYDAEIFYLLHPNIKVTFVERETGTKNILKNFLWIRKYFKQNADMIVSFLAPFNILALISKMGLKSSIIVADRNDPRFVPGNPLIRKLRDFLYRFAEGVVVQTKNNQAYFSESVQKNSTIIFNPVHLGDRKGQALKTEKKKRIVSVGRLMPQKNQELLIDAFARVNKKFPDYELTIYGDGPSRSKLETQISQLGIDSKVLLPGNEKDVFDKIIDAELFVLSSNYEGMPNALIEAMCLSLPVISTKVSGATDLIQEGINGLLVDVGDTDALEKAMIEMLGNEEKRQAYAYKALELNNKLSIDKIMNQWVDYLKRLDV